MALSPGKARQMEQNLGPQTPVAPISPGRARQIQEAANTPIVSPAQATSVAQPVVQSVTPTVAPTVIEGGNTTASTALDTTTSASQDIKDLLNSWGLGDLADTVWNNNKAGDPPAKIVAWIRSTPTYTARFPAMAAITKQGQAITEAQYLAKESADRALIYQYLGSSAHLYDSYDALGKIMSGFKSTVELQDHLQAAADGVLSADPATVQYLKDNGFTQGDLTAFWLNPDVTTADVQRRAAAGQLGGIAASTGTVLGMDQANQLANQGVTAGQARQGFGQIGQEGQFIQNLPGDTSGALTQQQLLDATFTGDAASLAQLNRVRGARIAQFQDSGGFAANQQGVSGLGTAATR